MTDTIRRMIALAEECGLKYVGTLDGKAHFRLVFENALGQRFIKLAPHGNGAGSSGRKMANSRSQFRRFARGETHGLYVLPARVTTSGTD